MRLLDLAPKDVIVVRCECGWIAHYGPGLLQRHHRVPSDTLIYDLQYRFRCKHCRRRTGFAISVEDHTNVSDVSMPRDIRVIVPKGD